MKIIRLNLEQPQDASPYAPYKGGTQEFEGDVTLQRLVSAQDSAELELLAVEFHNGARTRPHIHDADQVLHIIKGLGAVVDDDSALEVSAGDVVTIPAGMWHWHGARPGQDMLHLSIRKANSKTDWEVEQKDWAAGFEANKKARVKQTRSDT